MKLVVGTVVVGAAMLAGCGRPPLSGPPLGASNGRAANQTIEQIAEQRAAGRPPTEKVVSHEPSAPITTLPRDAVSNATPEQPTGARAAGGEPVGTQGAAGAQPPAAAPQAPQLVPVPTPVAPTGPEQPPAGSPGAQNPQPAPGPAAPPAAPGGGAPRTAPGAGAPRTSPGAGASPPAGGTPP